MNAAMSENADQYEFFTLSVSNHIAEVVLARPDVRNSMGEPFWRELPLIVDRIRRDADVRVVILHADGPHFCAGIDLDYARRLFTLNHPDDGRARDHVTERIRQLQAVFLQLERLHVPVIAAIHGACIGGGLELVCAADIRLCSEDAYFELKEVRLAIVADLGGLQRLDRQLPQGIARELIYTGRRFSSDEARQWNFVNGVHPDREALLAAARQLAAEIAASPPLTVKHIKESLVDRQSADIELELRRAATLQVAYGFGEDMKKAVAAAFTGEMPDFAPLHIPADPAKEG
jgi:enoyl-CoA hydratase